MSTSEVTLEIQTNTLPFHIATLMLETLQSGGSTVSLKGFQVPDSGYMVGGMVDSLIFDSKLITEPGHFRMVLEQITKWLDQNSTVAFKDSIYLGMWIDKETGQAYVDLSQRFFYVSDAMESAKFFGELAIWDLSEGKEIRVS